GTCAAAGRDRCSADDGAQFQFDRETARGAVGRARDRMVAQCWGRSQRPRTIAAVQPARVAARWSRPPLRPPCQSRTLGASRRYSFDLTPRSSARSGRIASPPRAPLHFAMLRRGTRGVNTTSRKDRGTVWIGCSALDPARLVSINSLFVGLFGNSRERGREKKNRTNGRTWIVRRAGRSECYAHEDADKARHNGHDTPTPRL